MDIILNTIKLTVMGLMDLILDLIIWFKNSFSLSLRTCENYYSIWNQ